MRRLKLSWLVLLLPLTGCRKDVSGSYLAVDDTAVCWAQLVRTPDDHLTGQMVLSILQSDGQIEHKSESLTGAVNGEDVTLTGGGLFGVATTTFSGTFSGDVLTLTGAESAPLVLQRAGLPDYQRELAKQTMHSQAITSARDADAARQRNLQAQRTFVSELSQLLVRMQHFDGEADVHLGRFPNAEKVFVAITTKVSTYVTRERQLAGYPNRAVDRSQLHVDAIQASLNTDQYHFETEGLQSSLETDIAPLSNEIANFERACDKPVQAGDVQAGARQTACDRLQNAAPIFRQKYDAMAAGLNHLEDVYKREKNSQDRLLKESEQME